MNILTTGAAVLALTISTAEAQAAPTVSIGQGADVWRTYSCVAAPDGVGYRGAIVATTDNGPQVDKWVALIEREGWGYQPPIWPDCADVLAQCRGQPSGKTFVQTFHAGFPTPPDPDGSTYDAQRWTTRITINC